MPHKPLSAGRGSRAAAFPRVPGPTHKNSETLLGLDVHLQKKKEKKTGDGWRGRQDEIGRDE